MHYICVVRGNKKNVSTDKARAPKQCSMRSFLEGDTIVGDMFGFNQSYPESVDLAVRIYFSSLDAIHMPNLLHGA